MAGEHDNAREEAVGPGDHPAGGPAAAPHKASGGSAAHPTDGGAAPRPPAGNSDPGAGNSDPGTRNSDPAAHNSDPAARSSDPGARNSGPAAGNGDPGASARTGAESEDVIARAAETAAAGPAGDSEAAPADHERQLERDLEELTAKAEKADEYLELARRTKADFENYRKRAAREAAAAQDRGIAKLAKELLPAVDNLDRAVQAAQAAAENPGAEAGNGTTDTLVSGIKLVHADVLAALARAGIERYSPHGEPFDPQRHEAIAQHPVDGAQPGTIVEVYQQGYLLGEAVIRPARVVVAG